MNVTFWRLAKEGTGRRNSSQVRELFSSVFVLVTWLLPDGRFWLERVRFLCVWYSRPETFRGDFLQFLSREMCVHPELKIAISQGNIVCSARQWIVSKLNENFNDMAAVTYTNTIKILLEEPLAGVVNFLDRVHNFYSRNGRFAVVDVFFYDASVYFTTSSFSEMLGLPLRLI